MSVLAHLVASRGEPGVTQALAYILNQQPDIVQAFVNLLGAADIRFKPRHRVESERGDDGQRIPGRPDMKIYDAENKTRDGKARVLVENKFWAGLTDAQPVGYLGMLPECVSSGLLFVVPGDRVRQIWSMLKTRCRNAGLVLGQESPEGDQVKWVSVETNKTMLVTDWQNVLDTLEGAADGQEIRGDIFQLRRLVETLENLEAFRAPRSDEVTNAEAAQRIINYIELLRPICHRLAESGIASGPHAVSFDGRSFHRDLTCNNGQGDEVSARLALSFDVWHRSGGITPLWLRIAPGIHPPEVFENLENLLEKERMYVFPGTNNKYIAIDLKLGVERDSVVEDAVEQIRRVCRKLT